jgi:glycopeptide antibiotics resistance protein
VTDTWLFGRWSIQVITAIATLPLAALAAVAISNARRRHGVPPEWAWRSTVAEVAMVIGTLPWIWMILTPLPGAGELHLIPFEDLRNQIRVGPAFLIVQVGANLLVFAAFGAFAPIRWRIGVGRVVIVAAVAAALVEFLQCALHLGRVSSIDDVIVNAAGAGLAALCMRRWWRRGTVSLDTT